MSTEMNLESLDLEAMHTHARGINLGIQDLKMDNAVLRKALQVARACIQADAAEKVRVLALIDEAIALRDGE
jgi:hypothetical protein